MSNKAKPTAMKNDSKLVLTPKLRFPEFRDAEGWKEKALKEIADINPPNRGLPDSFVYIDLESVEAGELKSKTVIAREGAPSRAQRLLVRGDIIFQVVRPYQRNNLLFDFEDDEDYVASTGYAQLRARASNRFLFQGIHTDTFVNRVIAKCTGSNYPAINSSDLAEICLGIPQFVSEQQKIAECLSSVDELIAAQARKLDALKTHKKGLMQQLFPREGETQPHLRFPEFQDAGGWQETSLGAVARLKNGYAFQSSEYVDSGDFHVITIANVQQGFLALDATKKIAGLPSDIQAHQILHVGDILISMTGNVGRVCLVTSEDLLLNQRVGKLVPYDINPEYFYQALLRGNFRNEMQLKAAGGAQGNLSARDITEYVLNCPTEPEEQQRIADCLSSFDELLTAQTQKLDALKTHKKGLMQQLFPSPEDVES